MEARIPHRRSPGRTAAICHSSFLRFRRAARGHALNSAIDAAEGRYVIFTDDDTIPGMYFLIAWLKAFHARTNYGMFGGSIDLVFETPPPEWMAEFPHTLAALFGERHLPEGPARWDDIFGGNMAIRRELFNQGFRFDESIGPGSGQGNRFGEDSEFCRRVADSGVRCWFAKEPIVQHVVRPHQLARHGLDQSGLPDRPRAGLPDVAARAVPASSGTVVGRTPENAFAVGPAKIREFANLPPVARLSGRVRAQLCGAATRRAGYRAATRRVTAGLARLHNDGRSRPPCG